MTLSRLSVEQYQHFHPHTGISKGSRDHGENSNPEVGGDCARLNHPVIDSDGHMIEFEAGVLDYLKQVGDRRAF